MRIALIIISLLVSSIVQAEVNLVLQERLLAMERSDQSIRKEIINNGTGQRPKQFLDKAKQIDWENTQELKQIIFKHGWPTAELVGKTGVSAAFLIVQHSSDTDFKLSLLPRLKESYKNDDGISGQQVALMTDKVLISKGKKQTYGTQYDVKEQRIIFKPIENAENINQLRAEMKMPPLDYYKRILEELHGIKDHPDIELN